MWSGVRSGLANVDAQIEVPEWGRKRPAGSGGLAQLPIFVIERPYREWGRAVTVFAVPRWGTGDGPVSMCA